MKLLRFGPSGQERPGLLDAQGRLRDLSAHVDDIAGDILLPASLARLAALDPLSLPLVEGAPRLGACVGRVGKMVCVGLNYSDHAAESNMAVPAEPVLFNKWTSAIVGPNDDVEIPPGSEKTDWEVELGVVIGQPARYVTKERALEHVAGYCVVNDVSERAYQLERGGQWDKGKGCDTFGPTGPWLVTRDEIPDVQSLSMWLDVDGRRFQTGSTRTMVFDVATLVSYISQFMSLQPGDVISTGTPPGVGLGQKPPVYLRPGQEMRLGIEGLGEQRQRTVAAKTGGRAMNQLDMQGRVVVVTGGAQGIGYAVSERLLKSGAAVVLWDINEAQLAKARAGLSALGEVDTRVVELTDEASVDAAAKAAVAARGRVDALVNSAGITGGNAPTWELSPEVWRRVIEVNLVGCFLTSRALVPQMISQGYGRIVNICSVAGKEGNPNASHYSASKAGLIGLTKSLGKELAKTGVLVNAVTPAAARTPIFDSMKQEHIDFMLSKIPMGRFLQVDEAAAMISWLCTEDCAFSTGAVFDLSGGRATY